MYTHRKGVVIEVRAVAREHSTNVNGALYTNVYFKNHYRVRWDDGREEFVGANERYSVGDRIAHLFRNNRYVADANLSTGKHAGGAVGVGCISVLVVLALTGLFVLGAMIMIAVLAGTAVPIGLPLALVLMALLPGVVGWRLAQAQRVRRAQADYVANLLAEEKA